MAILGLPEFLGRCKCGNLLVNDGTEPFWTMYEPYVRETKDIRLEEKTCPLCGGVANALIGDFHPPSSHLQWKHQFA